MEIDCHVEPISRAKSSMDKPPVAPQRQAIPSLDP